MNRYLPENDLKALLQQAEANGLALSELAALCETIGMAPRAVLNELAIAVAEGYLHGTLIYDFCIGVMNGIINAVTDLAMTEAMPQPAFALYQAFELGEWIRRDDPPETDPAETYARPVVEERMAAFRG